LLYFCTCQSGNPCDITCHSDTPDTESAARLPLSLSSNGYLPKAASHYVAAWSHSNAAMPHHSALSLLTSVLWFYIKHPIHQLPKRKTTPPLATGNGTVSHRSIRSKARAKLERIL